VTRRLRLWISSGSSSSAPGIALLSYVLEVFGEHTLSGREILGLLAVSAALLAGYGLHATHSAHPLLRLTLFRIRTFSRRVSGSFGHATRHRRNTFLFPLSYQVGLGFTPIQSGPPHDAASPRRHEL